MILRIALLFFGLGSIVRSATVTYDFNIAWISANPDGAFERPVMGINGQWPLPYIEATVGDRVVINVLNQLGNQTTSLHFHGLYMNGTTHMDGPVGVTQCAIGIGESFTYDFNVRLQSSLLIKPADFSRSTNLGLIGTTPMKRANILTGFVEL